MCLLNIIADVYPRLSRQKNTIFDAKLLPRSELFRLPKKSYTARACGVAAIRSD